MSLSKFYNWRKRYGKQNEHNASIPRDHWLTAEEKRAILDYERQYPLKGYRRLAFMMLDAGGSRCVRQLVARSIHRTTHGCHCWLAQQCPVWEPVALCGSRWEGVGSVGAEKRFPRSHLKISRV